MDRRRVLSLVGVLLLQVVVLVTVALGRSDGTPHGTSLALVAPPVVGSVLSDRISQDDAQVVTRPTERSALRELASGTVEAVVVVDLTTDSDRLLLSPTNGSRLDAGITDGVRAVSASLGRTVTVAQVDRPVMDRALVAALVVGAVIAGFLAAMAVAWRRGASEDRPAGARVRVLELAGASITGGLLVAIVAAVGGGAFVPWWLLGALVMGGGAATTSALLGLLGAPGAGVATALFVLTAAPLAQARHLLLLAEPWASIVPWLPLGAGLENGTALSIGGEGSTRSWVVLVVWIVLATGTASVARVLRVRATFGSVADS